MRFHDYPARQWNDILQGATSSAIDFVAQTIRYESTHRLTAEQVSDDVWAEFSADNLRP